MRRSHAQGRFFLLYHNVGTPALQRVAFIDYPCSGWMMWNFLIGALGICQIVLYDGSPLKHPAHLWNLVDDLGITIFGISAKYIDELSVRPHSALNRPCR